MCSLHSVLYLLFNLKAPERPTLSIVSLWTKFQGRWFPVYTRAAPGGGAARTAFYSFPMRTLLLAILFHVFNSVRLNLVCTDGDLTMPPGVFRLLEGSSETQSVKVGSEVRASLWIFYILRWEAKDTMRRILNHWARASLLILMATPCLSTAL